jgi:hypothetical protein
MGKVGTLDHGFLLFVVAVFFFFPCTQGLLLVRQVLFLLNHTPSLFLFLLILKKGLGDFAQAGLELAILLLPPLSIWDYRCATPRLAIKGIF